VRVNLHLLDSAVQFQPDPESESILKRSPPRPKLIHDRLKLHVRFYFATTACACAPCRTRHTCRQVQHPGLVLGRSQSLENVLLRHPQSLGSLAPWHCERVGCRGTAAQDTDIRRRRRIGGTS